MKISKNRSIISIVSCHTGNWLGEEKITIEFPDGYKISETLAKEKTLHDFVVYPTKSARWISVELTTRGVRRDDRLGRISIFAEPGTQRMTHDASIG